MDRSGAVAAEFALLAPVFLLIAFGLIEFGRLMWIRSTIQYAVQEAGRMAMVNPQATATQITTFAQSRVFGMNPAGITFAATAQTVDSVDFMNVTGTYQFDFLVPVIPLGPLTINARSRVPRAAN